MQPGCLLVGLAFAMALRGRTALRCAADDCHNMRVLGSSVHALLFSHRLRACFASTHGTVVPALANDLLVFAIPPAPAPATLAPSCTSSWFGSRSWRHSQSHEVGTPRPP